MLHQQKLRLMKPLLLILQIEEADECAQVKNLLDWLGNSTEREEEQTPEMNKID